MYTQIYNTVFSKSEFQQCPTTQSKLITIANRRALFNWVSKNQIQSDDNCQSEKRLPWLFMIKARENASASENARVRGKKSWLVYIWLVEIVTRVFWTNPTTK